MSYNQGHENPQFRHGHTGRDWRSPTYLSWSAMRARCRNPRNKKYALYGGRGIGICRRWDRFENFLEDMGERPRGMTLDRKNANGNYDPKNCRWATPAEQADNCRDARGRRTHCPAGHPYSGDNLYLTPKGERQCRICRREANRRCVERSKV